MSGPGDGHAELTIGIVGPHDLVERIMLSSIASAAPAASRAAGTAGITGGAGTAGITGTDPVAASRMVAAAYREEHEAANKVARLGPVVDAWLFASPVPLEHARRAGVLTAPAAAIALGGSALYAALMRATRQGGLDLGRSSVDVVGQDEVDDAFAELGIQSSHVHVRGDAVGAAELASFHERLWRSERTSVAFTGLQSVALRLSAARIPVFTLRPTGFSIRAALRTAALLGINRRLEEAQLAIVVIELPVLRDTARRALPRPAREELRLTVHKFRVQEARRIRATVGPLGDYGFLVTATQGSRAGATDRFLAPPFAARALAELGVEVEVGVGMGKDADEAETRARAALQHGRRGQAAADAIPGEPGHGLVSPAPQRAAGTAAPLRGLETLGRLAAGQSAEHAALVVDAEITGRLLGVTPRTARRLLHTLVEEGLAWPLPPSRTPQPGRPRQAYRLLVEKLPPGQAATPGSG